MTPPARAKTRDVWTARCARSGSSAPMAVAMVTLAPREMPWKSETSSETTEALQPTAAMASALTNRPVTATSATL